MTKSIKSSNFDKTRPVVFYGAGGMGAVFKEWLAQQGLIPACWADRNVEKQNKEFLGKMVFSFEEAVALYPNCYVYMTVSENNWEEISHSLAESGLISKDRILNFIMHKKYKSCTFLENAITTGCELLFPCCVSIPGRPHVEISFTDYYETIDRYIAMRSRVKEEINVHKGDHGCYKCRYLVEQYWPFSDRHFKINHLYQVDAGVCQFDCIYCIRINKAGRISNRPTADFKALLDAIYCRGLLAKEFLVDISGDEITTHPACDKILDAFSDYPLTVYSNAATYNEIIGNSMLKKGSSLIISLDAGSPETFYRIKQRNVFDEVCENIRRYAATGAAIVLKYLILPGINDNFTDASSFFRFCMEINAKKIIISRDEYTGKGGTDLPDSAIETARNMLVWARDGRVRCELWDSFTENDLHRLGKYGRGVLVKYSQYEKELIKHISIWFADKSDRKIAIYGYGFQTKNIINNFPNLNIVCLLDAKHEGKMMWGKEVLSVEDAKKRGVNTVIIAALPAHVPLIYKRIEEYCVQNGIEVYGMNGRRLDQDKKPVNEVLNEFSANPANKPVIEKFLSSPPVMNAKNGKLVVKSNYDIGYSFIAPIACKFLFWIARQAREQQLDFLLLAGRECWVLEKMIEILNGNLIALPSYSYFLVSRAATLIAGLTNEAEIRHSYKMTFHGKVEKLLAVRYRLSGDEILPKGDESDLEYIIRHKDMILRNAAAQRDNYRRYLSALALPVSKRIGFVDFLSVGTCMWGLERIMEQDLSGLFFAHRHNDDFAYMNISGLFETACLHIDRNYVEENHYFLETIFTSPGQTLLSFDTNGKPLFCEEERNAERLQSLNEIHEGILDYTRSVLKQGINFDDVDLPLLDYFVHFLSERYCEIETGYFEKESLTDEFTNAMYTLQ